VDVAPASSRGGPNFSRMAAFRSFGCNDRPNLRGLLDGAIIVPMPELAVPPRASASVTSRMRKDLFTYEKFFRVLR
jgi:hypothetical protein